MQLRWPPLGSSGSEARTHAGWWGGQRFSKNRSPVRAVGRAHEGGRAPGEVGEHHRRDPPVVIDHVGFAESRRGVQQLVEVRERELAALDLDVTLFGPTRCGLTPPSAISRMGPYAQCHLDRCDQLRSRASPVKLVGATKNKDVSFNQLEKGSGARIRYRKVSDKPPARRSPPTASSAASRSRRAGT